MRLITNRHLYVHLWILHSNFCFFRKYFSVLVVHHSHASVDNVAHNCICSNTFSYIPYTWAASMSIDAVPNDASNWILLTKSCCKCRMWTERDHILTIKTVQNNWLYKLRFFIQFDHFWIQLLFCDSNWLYAWKKENTNWWALLILQCNFES